MSISTAVSGLLTYQRALDTTSHNISNVATEGYSRQRVELATRNPQLIGPGYIGKGVNAVAINRVYDQFLVDQTVSRTSSLNQFSAYNGISSQLDSVLGNTNSGLSSALEGFFNAVQDVSTNPSSVPARQVLISQAQTLNGRFASINQTIDNLQTGVNSQMDAMVSQINSLSEAVAELNIDIVRASGEAGGNPPNDLLDQRDRLVKEIAQYTNVQTSEQSDRSLSVFIGSGQALVLGASFNTMAISRDDFDVNARQISFVTGSTVTPITNALTGGKLGGLLDVKNDVLDPAQMGLGRLAMAISSEFNTQHQLGDDLSGTAGGLFFSDIISSSPVALSSQNNNAASGTFAVSITDINNVQPSDYRLNYDGANFSLVRLSDNSVVDSGFSTAALPRTIASEGISIALTGSVASGDSFLVRPTRYAAGSTGMVITDPADVAAAASGGNVGDNSNALALAALQTTKGLAGGTASYQEAYGVMVADVGIKTNQAGISEESQKVLLNQAEEAASSVSGVNLDEEAANLIKYQQAYQAAAQAISANENLFQILISAVS